MLNLITERLILKPHTQNSLASGKLQDELVVHITLLAKQYDEYAISFFIWTGKK